jgi:hypothetical protein
MDSLLLIAIVAAAIFVLLIPGEIWKIAFWLVALAVSGFVAFWAFTLWIIE